MKVVFQIDDDHWSAYLDWHILVDFNDYPMEFHSLEEAKEFVARMLKVDVSVFDDK